MSLFGVRWIDCPESDEYMGRVSDKLNLTNMRKDADIALFFINGRVVKINDVWVVDLAPSMPKFYLLLPLVMFGFLIFGVTAWWPYILLGTLTVFAWLWWKPFFYVWVMKQGFKKMYKTKASIELICAEDVARLVLGWAK